MMLFPVDLKEIRETKYDSRLIKAIITKAEKNIPRTEEEADYIIYCTLANALKATKLSCVNLVVGITEEKCHDKLVSFTGFAYNKMYGDKDYIHLNVKKDIIHGDKVMFLHGLNAIGHEAEHIRQGRELYSYKLSPTKIFTFFENCYMCEDNDYYQKHHDEFMIEKTADFAGTSILKNMYKKHLDRDISISELKYSAFTCPQDRFYRDEFIKNAKIYLNALSKMDKWEYYDRLKDAHLDGLLPSTPGTLHCPDFYLRLYDSTEDEMEKRTYGILYTLSKYAVESRKPIWFNNGFKSTNDNSYRRQPSI